MFSKAGSQFAAALVQMQAVQNNPQIPPAMKAQILQGMGVLAAMTPTQQNLDAVKPFVAELAPILK
jgi:hypothetical protein